MAENQLQIIVQQSAEVTKNVASIKTDITNAIRENNTSLQNCIKAGEALLAQSGEMTDELDAQIASFIKKASVTQKAMTERNTLPISLKSSARKKRIASDWHASRPLKLNYTTM